MTTNPKRNDAFLLTAVAGCVIAGAAALALFGGIAADRDARENAEATTPATRAVLADRTGEGPVLAKAPATREPATFEAKVPVPAEAGGETVENEESVVATCEREDGETWVAAGVRNWDARSYAAAGACFARADQASPDRAWIVYMRGLTAWKAGDHALAETELARALAIDADCVRCAVNLARVRNETGDLDGALAAARAAIAADPDDADARYLEARSLYNLTRVDEALDALGEVVRLDPDHGHAHNLTGLILLQADLEERAREPLETARDLLPEVAYVRNNLGLVYERLGRHADAVVEFRAASDLDGGDGPAAVHLARIDPNGTIEADVLMAAAGTPETADDAGPAGGEGEGSDTIEIAAVEPAKHEEPDGMVPDAGLETP